MITENPSPKFSIKKLVPTALRKWVQTARERREVRRTACPRIKAFQPSVRKIIYALIPPPTLPNLGDHAQVIAIRRWIGKHFPDRPVLEVDKNEVLYCNSELKSVVNPDDLFLLHSGGNLGDRGLWSERGRRQIIESFPENQIVSLPQTIYFSDTPEGQRQQSISQAIYSRHRKLTVIGRDEESGRLAAELFPTATTFAMPDFVLSLDPAQFVSPEVNEEAAENKILLCLRNDNESNLTADDRQRLIAAISAPHELYDTTLENPIATNRQEELLAQTLTYFSSFAAVVTDRYHGLIFSVLCKRPTVVLPTVDHKLTSAFDWFKGIQGLRFAKNVGEVPALLEEVRSTELVQTIDWNREYFDPLAERVKESQ